MSTVNTTYLPTAITSNTLAAQGTNSSSNTNTSSGGLQSLTPQDFIQMMITQLENQDPLNPTDSQDILSQVSEIGQLQSSDSLDTSLTGMTLQNQVGSASSLIGKTVQGIDPNNNQTEGVVTGVSINQSANTVNLTLDNGDTLPLTGVSAIAQTTGSSSGTATNAAVTTNTSTPTADAAAAVQAAIQQTNTQTVGQAVQSLASAL